MGRTEAGSYEYVPLITQQSQISASSMRVLCWSHLTIAICFARLITESLSRITTDKGVHIMSRLLPGLLLFLAAEMFAQSQQPQFADVFKNVHSILKRKDVDDTKLHVTKDCLFLLGEKTEGLFSTSRNVTTANLLNVLDERDRARALGQGAYEDTMATRIIKISPTSVILLVQTKWSGYEGGRQVTNDRINTIALELIENDWKVIHWHASIVQR